MPEEKSEQKQPEKSEPPALWRRLSAELLGTFVLTFVAAGADIVEALSDGQIGHVARYIAPAIAVMAMIWSISGISGAHINPAVSWAFFVRRCFPLRDLPGYICAQLVGAVAAAGILRALFGPAIARGITKPTLAFTNTQGFAAETILTFLLVFVILGTADQKAVVGKNAALGVAGVIALCGLAFSPLSGASMNPARTLGPMAVAGDFSLAWLYVIAPLLGATLAAAAAWVLYGHPHSDERKTAQGA